MKIYNLYAKPYKTGKYETLFMNAPVERLDYYPEHDTAYLTVSAKVSEKVARYTMRVPNNLLKTALGHLSDGRRITCCVDNNHIMGHLFCGEESLQEIRRQVAQGERPTNWANPNHPDWNKWQKRIKGIRKNPRYDDERKEYGYAKVKLGKTPTLGWR